MRAALAIARLGPVGINCYQMLIHKAVLNCGLAALLLAALVSANAQIGPEIIRGRVTSDSGLPVAGAMVSVTFGADRAFQQVTTDFSGRFTIAVPNGTGDYLVHVSALGFRAFRKRVTRVPNDTGLVVEVRLVAEVTQLAPVRVEARQERPRPGFDPSRAVGAADRPREGVFAALAPDQEGNLSAIGNAIPGVSSQAGGLSVLGLSGAQSNVTLNGMAFGGTALPRDAQVQVRVATSPYDPARGGFSGAQTTVELGPGRRAYRRQAHAILDVPPLQASSELGDQLGQRFTAVNGSIGGSGESVENVWYYSSALQASRRLADAASLLSVGNAAAIAAGVAPDSVARFRDILGAKQIPASSAGAPQTAISQTMSFITRIDHAPYLPGGYEPATHTWNITLFGNATDNGAQGLSPTTVVSHGGRRMSVFSGVQADMSRYFHEVLNDSRVALSVSHDQATPYLTAPSGMVIVSSVLPGGDAAVTDLVFGGSGSLDFTRRSWTLEAINETQWYSRRGSHRLKLTWEARSDGYSQSLSENQYATFVYPSLEALATNQPSSFSRQLYAPGRAGGQFSGFVALGDYWHVTRSLELMYGTRVEANRFTTTLVNNSSVLAAFGTSTTHAPNGAKVSPRLGFNWYFGKEPQGNPIRFNAVANQTLPSTMLLRGGVGLFRQLLSPTLLADAASSNGTSGGAVRLSCIGPATPSPQWADYVANPGSVPTSCANGAPPALTDVAPGVRLFDKSFGAPQSWRANLGWIAKVGRFAFGLDGVYSLNNNQASTADLNFRGVPAFTLSNESARPVYVPASAIVPATGVVSPVEGRLNNAFGSVLSTRSDLSSVSRQVTATVTPAEFNRFYFGLAYTLSDVRSDSRGFDGTTFDDPSRVDRAPNDLDVRHQIQASVGALLPHGFSVALFGRFMSGLPYTPRIATDINGDGLANDRAFVFDPTHVTDASLSRGIQSLLVSAPTQARDCLRAQLGSPAERDSCRGPWTAYLNARIGLIDRTGFTQRSFNATLNITNPIGGLDQLLHGQGHLQGWGGGALSDDRLLTVRGFDPAVDQFLYSVNPRFGSTRSIGQLARVPFRLTLDMSFDLGLPIVKQQAVKLLNPGRKGHAGSRLSADSITTLLRRQVPDIYDAIVREGDSLLVTPAQVQALRAAQLRYRARIDSLWQATAPALATMNDAYDADVAMHLIDDATEHAWIISRDELPLIAQILSPLQMQMAPWLPALRRSIGKSPLGIRVFMF